MSPLSSWQKKKNFGQLSLPLVTTLKTAEDSLSIHPKRQELVVAYEKLKLLSLTGKGFHLIPYLTKGS